MTPDLLKLADRYRLAREAFRVEMAKRQTAITSHATKEEVAAREALGLAEIALLEACMVPPREDGPVLLPDLRLGRAEKQLVEEALARTGGMRLAAQLLGISMVRLRSAMKRHGIVWPRPAG